MFYKEDQEGGSLSSDEVWEKYKNKLIEKLRKDNTYISETNILKLPDNFIFENPKYLEWIVDSYINDGIKFYEDLNSIVKSSIDFYDYLLSKNILSEGTKKEPWTNERNINNYCGLYGCKTGKFQKSGLLLLLDKYKEVKQDKKKYHSLLLENDNVKIYEPQSEEEAHYYGQGTKWCTNNKGGENWFYTYYERGPLYIIVPKHRKYKGEKYQIHYITNQFKNEQGISVDVKELFIRFPELKRTILTIDDAIIIKDMNSIKYFIDSNNVLPSYKTFQYAVETGDVEIIKYVMNNLNGELTDNVLNSAFLTKNIDIIKYFMDFIELNKLSFDNVLNYAIQTKNMDIIKYIKDFKGFKVNEESLNYAIGTRNMDIIKYVKDLNVKVNENSLNHAIETRNIDIIKYVKDLNGKANYFSLDNAIKTKNIDIIKYVFENFNTITTNNSLNYAIETKNMDIIKYVFDNVGVYIKSYIYLFNEKEELVHEYKKYLDYLNLIIKKVLKLNPNKYRSSCLMLSEYDLKKILKSVNIIEINKKDISELNKYDMCWFLDENYQIAEVVFSN